MGKGELWPGNSQVYTEITLASKKDNEIGNISIRLALSMAIISSGDSIFILIL